MAPWLAAADGLEMSGWGSPGTLTWERELCRAPGCHLAPATQFYSGTNSRVSAGP